MLTFWTAGDPASVLKAVKPMLDAIRPTPEWRTVQLNGNLLAPCHNEVVLVMGGKPFDLLKGAGLVPKNRTLASYRGKRIAHDTGGSWMVTFDPGMIFMDAAAPENIGWDIRLAHRLLTTGTLTPEVGHYSYADDLSAVVEYVEWKFAETGKKVDVALDTETMGLWPWYPDKHIVTVQVSVEEGVSDVVYTLGLKGTQLEKFVSQLRWLMTTDKVSLKGANLKYDLVWVWVKWGIDCTNFRMDTLLVGSLLNENRSNSLNMHAKLFTSMGGYDDAFNDKYDKGKMEVIPKDDLLVYAGGDTDACLRAFTTLRRQLRAEGKLYRFYTRLLHPAVQAFERLERRGMVVDLDEYKKLEVKVRSDIDRLEQEMLALVPVRMRMKHLPAIEAKLAEGKTPFTAKLLVELFFSKEGFGLKPVMVTAKKGDPSTSNDHLVMFHDHPKAGPFVDLLEEVNSARKTLSTYITGFLEHLRPDGRFHPTYMLYAGSMFESKDDNGGTVTGRTSAKNPAVQTIPKHTKWAKPLRKCYPAPPGMKFFQTDYAQGELKITACVANEKTMLAAYKQGLDLHAVTGAKLAGYDFAEFMKLSEAPEGSEELATFSKFRSRAKPANFGLLYGMGAEGFREFCRTAYGLKLTSAEAEAMRNAFFDLYPGLVAWHTQYRNLAHKNGYVVSPLGRVRHLPLIQSKMSDVRAAAERQAINSPIQGCLSDMCMWSIATLEEMYAGNEELQIIGMTHDSIYGYVAENNAVEWMRRVTNVMANLPLTEVFGWSPQLQFTADAELGPTFADLEKVKL